MRCSSKMRYFFLMVMQCFLIRAEVGSLSLGRRNSKYLKSPTQTYINTDIKTNIDGTNTFTDIIDQRSARKVFSKQEKRQNLRKQNRQKSKSERDIEMKQKTITTTQASIANTSPSSITLSATTTFFREETSPSLNTEITTENFESLLKNVLDYYRTEIPTTKVDETKQTVGEQRSIIDNQARNEIVEDRRLNDRHMPQLERYDNNWRGKVTTDEKKLWRKSKRKESRGKLDKNRANDMSNKGLKKTGKKERHTKKRYNQLNDKRVNRKNRRPEEIVIDYGVNADSGDRSEIRKIRRKSERLKNKVGSKQNNGKHRPFISEHDTHRNKHSVTFDGYQPYNSKHRNQMHGNNIKLNRKAERQRKRQKIKQKETGRRNLRNIQESASSQRGHSVSMFDLQALKKQIFGANNTASKPVETTRQDSTGLLQITGTSAFDSFFGNFSTAVQNAFTVTLVAFAIALWVSVFVFWFDGAEERREPSHYYDDWNAPSSSFYHPTGIRNRVARVLEYISPDSLERLVDGIRPALSNLSFKPTLQRMGTEALDGVGTFSNIATALILGTASTLSEKMSGGVGTVSDIVGNKKIQDCLLQTVCYYSASHGQTREGRTGVKRMLEVFGLDNEFEGRKRGGKKDRRKKKTKKKDDTFIEESSGSENAVDNEISDDDLNTSDCEVFECSVVSLGHTAYSLYDRVSNLSDKIRGR